MPNMEDVEISQEAKETVKEVDLMVKEVKDFKIKSIKDLEMSANLLKQVKNTKSKWEEERKKATRPLDAAKKTIMDWFRPTEVKLEEAENCIKKEMLIFQEAERKKAEEEARKAREEAEKIRKAELEKLEKERQEAEMCEDEEKMQEIDRKQEVVETMAEVASVTAPAEMPKIKGVNEVKRWKAEVTDKKAFITYVLETGNLENAVEVLQPEINKFATATKGTIKVPGLKIIQETGIACR